MNGPDDGRPMPAPASGLRRRLLFGGAAVAALAAGAASFYALFAPGAGADVDLLAVTLPDADGTLQPIAQWRGKVLVVNFWATWCVPCREEIPDFVRLQDELRDKVQFVGIAIDDAAKVKQFAQELAVNYPLLIGGYGAMELSRSLGNRLAALPFTAIVDRGGRIAHVQLGVLKPAQLRAISAKL